MTIYRYTFPIPGYYREEVFYQHLYVQAEDCPTREQMVVLLQRKHKEGKQQEGYFSCWEECLEVLSNTERGEFPRAEGGMLGTNVFCTTAFGRQPLSVRVIEPEKLMGNQGKQ